MNRLDRFLLSNVLRDNEAGGAAAGAGAGDAAAAAAAAAKGGAGAGKPYEGPWEGNPAFGFDAEKDKDLLVSLAGKKYPDVKTALRSGIEAEGLARSRNVIEAPDPKNLKAWKGWEQLGWTPEAEKYVLADTKGADGVVPNMALRDVARKIAHEQRVPLAATQAIVDGVTLEVAKQHRATLANGEKSYADAQTALDAKWGADKPAKIELGRAAMRAFGVGMDDVAELQRVLGKDGDDKLAAPRVVELFAKIGEWAKLNEHALPDGGNQLGGQTPSSIEAELLRLEQSEDFQKVSQNTRDARYKPMMAQRQNLIDKLAAAGGGKSKA